MMKKVNILDAVDRLSSTLSKVEAFTVNDINLSDRVLDNRIITLEGYLRFLEMEGVPKIASIWEKISETRKDDYND
jgi:hypothetical protein